MDDERQRLLTITKKGKKVYCSLENILDKIKKANKELIHSSGRNLITALAEIENELDKRSMFERVWELIDGGLPGEIEICEYSAGMKKYFKQLNYEWLEEYFTVEDFDKDILLNPKEKIINTGGAIFFALLENQVVGTCAMLNHGDGLYEIGKMAVTKKLRGYGIGRKLLNKCVQKAKSLGIKEIYLLTNKNLIAANSLYRSFGFKKIKNSPIDKSYYQRETYAMKYKIL
ncbi:MAG: GNAT family N-acetyltransferase [bacterium]